MEIKNESKNGVKNESKNEWKSMKIEMTKIKVENQKFENKNSNINANQTNDNEIENKTQSIQLFGQIENQFPIIETTHDAILSLLTSNGNNNSNQNNGFSGYYSASYNNNKKVNYQMGFHDAKRGIESRQYFNGDIDYKYGYDAGLLEKEVIQTTKELMIETSKRKELEKKLKNFIEYDNNNSIPPVPGQRGRKEFILYQLLTINSTELDAKLEKLYSTRWTWK